ncbi:MAG: hypothetical protein ASARMPRED_002633 [Alectoria sarmentosa]|nr:MAG: hypothetical protein ASARMPRED_002633 [Alectoria sarmentosa]
MDAALARLARVAEGNHINLLNSGQSSLPPPSGGKPATSLFGSLNTSQPQQNANSMQAQTSSLFGNTSQPAQTSSLFGNTTSQPAQTSSLFGNTTSQPAQTSSLFGNTSSLPQQGGGMFGSNQNQAGNSQQQQQGSSLFGGNQNTQSGGGLFGSQQTNQQTLGGLFGSTNAQQTQPQQASLFDSIGQSQAQHPQATLFNGTGNQNRTGNMPGPAQNQQSTMQPPPVRKLFPSQIGQYTQQQQTVPGVRILDVNQLRSTTRFNDLHEDLQKVIEYVDNFILGQIRCQEECAQHTEDIDQKCHQMPPDVEYCTKALDTMQQVLENDAESIAFAKDLVKGDVADAKLSFRTIQNLKMPQQFHQSGMWNTTVVSQSGGSSFPEEDAEVGASRNIVEYFSKQADEMTKTLEAYKRTVGQVETYLRGVESNTMQQMEQMMFTRGQDGGEKSAEEQVRELAAVLRDFEHGITGVATRVGGTRDKVQEVMLGPDDMIGGLRTMR